MNQSFNKKVWLGIFLLALGLRLLLFVYVVVVTHRGVFDFYAPDSQGYDLLATNLLQHGAFTQSPSAPFEPDLYRTPIYPAFLAVIYFLFGHNINIAVVIQFVLGAAMAVIAAHLGKKLFGFAAGLAAGVIVAVDLLSMSLQLALMSETVFTFLLLVSFYFLVEYLKTQDKKQLISSALMYGLTVLCRPVAQWFFLIIGGLLFFCFRNQWLKALRASLMFVSISVLTISPWIIRNHRVAGIWGLSSLTEVQLITWAAAIEGDMQGLVLGSNYHEYSERLNRLAAEQQLSRAETLKMQRRIAWQAIKEHPGIALKLPVLGFLRMFGGVTGVGIWGYSDGGTGAAAALVRGELLEAFRRVFSQGVMRAVLLAGQYLVMLLIYIAVFYGLRRSLQNYAHRENPMLWLALPIIYFGGLSLGPNAYSRLLVPVIPFIAIMAGYGISEYRTRRGPLRRAKKAYA